MVTLSDVLSARRAVQAHLWRTPLLRSEALSRIASADVYLKLECWQRTGSFKARGALARLAALSTEDRALGIVTASAGNHGLGVAYASQAFGLAPATVFVPENAAPVKVKALGAFDCVVRRAGVDYDATHALAEEYALGHGALYISAYDDPIVIAGQGTVGLEVLEDLPSVDLLLVPVGGGGLIAGMALVAKTISPTVRVVGVQPAASPAAYLSLRDGRPYETYPSAPTICDGLAGGFGRLPFEISADLIDQVVVVEEASVREAVRWLLTEEQLVVEASGAIAIAPLLTHRLEPVGQKITVVLTGRNLDAGLLRDILQEQAGDRT